MLYVLYESYSQQESSSSFKSHDCWFVDPWCWLGIEWCRLKQSLCNHHVFKETQSLGIKGMWKLAGGWFVPNICMNYLVYANDIHIYIFEYVNDRCLCVIHMNKWKMHLRHSQMSTRLPIRVLCHCPSMIQASCALILVLTMFHRG